MENFVRIFVKTISFDGVASHENVGFIGLRALLQKRSPLVGLSFEANDPKSVNATYYLYTLNEDESGEYIKRYPLQDNFSLNAEFTCARTITDHFTASKNNSDDTLPAIPENAAHYLFSEEEKNKLLSSMRNCFLLDGADVFQNADPDVVNSVFSTLFSAGFITHANWKNNLKLLVENKNKLTEIASALFALHEVGFLNQIIFTAILNHAKPWECASALRELTDSHFGLTIPGKKDKIRAVIFNKARDSDHNLFSAFSPKVRSLYNHFVAAIINHPFPREISRILLFFNHAMEQKLDSDIVDDIACITDRHGLTVLGAILFSMFQNKILNSENCIALLRKSLKHQSIYYAVTHTSKLSEGKLELNQSLFDWIITFEGDPRILVSQLAKPVDPATSVTLFARLAQASIGTAKNLDVFCNHPNIQARDRLLNEIVTADIPITQIIFDLLFAHPNPREQSAIEILASSLVGRNELRNYLTMESGEFLFGKTKIPPEILAISVENKKIAEWLSISTEEEFAQKTQATINAFNAEIEPAVLKMQADKEALRDLSIKIIHKSGLFSLREKLGIPKTGGKRSHSEVLTPVLQNLVYGNENEVKAALEDVKTDPEKLSALLCNISTVTDYSGRTVTDTLFKAALRSGDVEMCQMLTPYFELIPNGSAELELQFAEVFPEGVDAHDAEQQQNTFNFDAILTAIKKASPAQLDAALNKTGAQFRESNDARVKPDDQLTLVEALNRFREQLADLSLKEKTFNPHHLLRAYEMYEALWKQCESDGSDPGYKKRDLFWRQIIGYVQCFMPACYAQAFVQGLWNLVKVDGYQSSDWLPKLLERALKFKYDPGSYFPLSNDSCSGLGFDFGLSSMGPDRGRPLADACRGRGFYKSLCCTKTSVCRNLLQDLCQRTPISLKGAVA